MWMNEFSGFVWKNYSHKEIEEKEVEMLSTHVEFLNFLALYHTLDAVLILYDVVCRCLAVPQVSYKCFRFLM